MLCIAFSPSHSSFYLGKCVGKLIFAVSVCVNKVFRGDGDKYLIAGAQVPNLGVKVGPKVT